MRHHDLRVGYDGDSAGFYYGTKGNGWGDTALNANGSGNGEGDSCYVYVACDYEEAAQEWWRPE